MNEIEAIEVISPEIYDYKTLESQFKRTDVEKSQQCLKNNYLNFVKLKCFSFLKIFSIITTISEYNVRKFLVKDFLSGILIGTLSISQGM